MSDFLLMRKNMVKGQILPQGISNPNLIEAFLKVPREKFFPRQLSLIAYMDQDLPLQNNRFILRPSTLSGLFSTLDPLPTDSILYVGSGVGYGPAILGKMGSKVIALDAEEQLTQEAEKIIGDLEIPSVKVVLGKLCEGWKSDMLYDKILIEGCIDFIPQSLISLLKEGGTIITIMQPENTTMKCVKFIKKEGVMSKLCLFDVFAPRLKSFKKDIPFIF